MAYLSLTTIIVVDYDEAIDFFTRVVGFDLVEDSPAVTEDGEPKRWVVVRPPGAETGVLLAQATDEEQRSGVGHQAGTRVAFFLRVEDFDAAYERLVNEGARFVRRPRSETYGRVAVFLDVAGNRWDLLGPLP